MKTLLALAILASSSAMAAPVAKIVTSGGYTMRPTTTTLTVEANGTVNLETVIGSYEPNVKPEIKKVKVAKLNAGIVATLVKDVAEANNTKIVADDPEAPECMDAPGVVYSAVKDGAMVEIGKKINCKAYNLDDYQGRTAMTILDSLRTLAYSAE